MLDNLMGLPYLPYLIIGSLIVSIIAFGFIYSYARKRRRRDIEDMMVKNAAGLIRRIEELERMKGVKQGGHKMSEEMKKLARFIAKKIEEAKEEIIDEIETKGNEVVDLIEGEEPEEDQEEEPEEPEEEEADEYAEFDDAVKEPVKVEPVASVDESMSDTNNDKEYVGERKVIAAMPVEEEQPKKKKGRPKLFGRKKAKE